MTVNVFHTPPRNQGQIVEVSYAATDDGHVIRRRYDASDRSATYEISPSFPGDEGDYWNEAPSNNDWEPMTATQLRHYGLS